MDELPDTGADAADGVGVPIVGPLWRRLRKLYRGWKRKAAKEAVEQCERSIRGEQVLEELGALGSKMDRLSQALQDGNAPVVDYIADDIVTETEDFVLGLEDAIGTTALSEVMAARLGAIELRKRVRTIGEPATWDLGGVWTQHDTVERAVVNARGALKAFMQRRESV